MAKDYPQLAPDTGAIPVSAPLAHTAQQYQQLSQRHQRQKKKAAQPLNKEPIPVQLKVLIAASFVIALGFGLIAPVLPRYATSFDVGVTAASALISIFAVTRLIFAPASGRWASRYGERPTYITGLVIVALSSLGTALAWDYLSLLLLRGLGGIGSVMFTVSAMGLLVKLSPPNLRGRISGLYATSFLLGNILGPVLGSALSGLGMRLPFVIYAAALFVAALLVFFYLKDPAAEDPAARVSHQQEELSLKEALSFSTYRAALTTNFALGWAGMGIRISLLPLAALALLAHYHGHDGTDVQTEATALSGYALACYATGNALTQNISGPLSDRYGRRLLIFAGLLLAATSTATVGYLTHPLLFVVMSTLTGIGAGFLAPPLQASVADIIGSSRPGGKMLASFQMTLDLGQILGPILAGLLADHWGFGPAFALSAALLLISALGYLPWRKPKFPAELAEPGYTGR